MAASAPPLLLLLLLLLTLSLVSIPASARPCTTFFFYSTTTAAATKDSSPYFNIVPFRSYPSSIHFPTSFFTPQDLPNHDVNSNSKPGDYFSLRHYPFPRFIINEEQTETRKDGSVNPVGLYTRRNRMRDLVSVIGASLFGLGCGALTAATMYLVWSLFSPHGFDFEEDESGDNDDVNCQGFGYVIIPDEDIDAIKKAAQAKAKIEAGAA